MKYQVSICKKIIMLSSDVKRSPLLWLHDKSCLFIAKKIKWNGLVFPCHMKSYLNIQRGWWNIALRTVTPNIMSVQFFLHLQVNTSHLERESFSWALFVLKNEKQWTDTNNMDHTKIPSPMNTIMILKTSLSFIHIRAGLSEAGLRSPKVTVKYELRYGSLKSKFSLILFAYNLMIGYSKNNGENYLRECFW